MNILKTLSLGLLVAMGTQNSTKANFWSRLGSLGSRLNQMRTMLTPRRAITTGVIASTLPYSLDSREFFQGISPQVTYNLTVPAASDHKRFTAKIAPLYFIHKCRKQKGNCLTEFHLPVAMKCNEHENFAPINYDKFSPSQQDSLALGLDRAHDYRTLNIVDSRLGLYRTLKSRPPALFKSTWRFNSKDINPMLELLEKNNMKIQHSASAIASEEQPLGTTDWAKKRALNIEARVPVVVDSSVSVKEIQEEVELTRKNLQK